MQNKLTLEKVAEHIDMVMDTSDEYYNKRRGEFKSVFNHNADMWMDFDEESEKEREDIFYDDDFIKLPDQYEINEYEIMSDFAESAVSANHSQILFRALNGRKPFRTFKDRINSLGIDSEYYEFRYNAYIEIGRKWCLENEIEFEERAVTIRPIKNNEIMLLTDFLYEAIFQRDKTKLAPRTIIQDPKIWIYIDRFGTKKDDYCLAAEVEGKIVGAVWVRCIKGFGQIDETVPELAISTYPEHRNRGIGTELMKGMLAYLRDKGYAKTSLAVQKDNYAVRMYKKVGYKIAYERGEEYIMVCEL